MITSSQAMIGLGLLYFMFIYSESLKEKDTLRSKITVGLINSLMFAIPAYLFALAELVFLTIISMILLIIYWVAYGADWLRMVIHQYQGEDIKSLEEDILP